MSAVLKTPVGWLEIRTDGDAVVDLSFQPQRPADADASETDPLAFLVADALAKYFAGGEWPTDLPLAPSGTPFQEKVWQAMAEIPSGETRTYGELAKQLHTGPRAIGGACRANRIVLLIPCHRVVAANGDGGFAGQKNGPWMDIKRWLLAHESKNR